jgi:hypothetical protein
MKKFILFLLIVVAHFTLSSFKSAPPGTNIGYQVDANYVYWIYDDETVASPYPVTYIEVHPLNSATVLTTLGFSGAVTRTIHFQYNFSGTAHVSFKDLNGNTVEKDLTGFIEGGLTALAKK